MKFFSKIKPYLDKQLFLITICFYSAFTFFALLKMVYFKSVGERFVNNTWSFMFFETYFTDYMLVIFFMSIVTIITKFLVLNQYKRHIIVFVHLFLSIFLGFFIFFGLVCIQKIFGSNQIPDLTFERVAYFYMNVLDLNFLIYFSIVVITHIYLAKKQLKETHLQKIQLTQNLAQAKIKVLHSQIQPHFLFNALNNIQALIDIDKEKSKSMLVDLSDLLRLIIDYKNENLTELQDELLILDKYLGIIKIRFSNDFEVEKKIEKNLENALIPSMLLQIIFENAIKHGYSPKNLKLKVLLNIKKVEDKLQILVENNGKPITGLLDDHLNKGLGLKNICARLKSLYEENYTFEIDNGKSGVFVKILIPLKMAEYRLSDSNN